MQPLAYTVSANKSIPSALASMYFPNTVAIISADCAFVQQPVSAFISIIIPTTSLYSRLSALTQFLELYCRTLICFFIIVEQIQQKSALYLHVNSTRSRLKRVLKYQTCFLISSRKRIAPRLAKNVIGLAPQLDFRSLATFTISKSIKYSTQEKSMPLLQKYSNSRTIVRYIRRSNLYSVR